MKRTRPVKAPNAKQIYTLLERNYLDALDTWMFGVGIETSVTCYCIKATCD